MMVIEAACISLAVIISSFIISVSLNELTKTIREATSKHENKVTPIIEEDRNVRD